MRTAERVETGWATMWILALVVEGLLCTAIAARRGAPDDATVVASPVERGDHDVDRCRPRPRESGALARLKARLDLIERELAALDQQIRDIATRTRHR